MHFDICIALPWLEATIAVESKEPINASYISCNEFIVPDGGEDGVSEPAVLNRKATKMPAVERTTTSTFLMSDFMREVMH